MNDAWHGRSAFITLFRLSTRPTRSRNSTWLTVAVTVAVPPLIQPLKASYRPWLRGGTRLRRRATPEFSGEGAGLDSGEVHLKFSRHCRNDSVWPSDTHPDFFKHVLPKQKVQPQVFFPTPDFSPANNDPVKNAGQIDDSPRIFSDINLLGIKRAKFIWDIKYPAGTVNYTHYSRRNPMFLKIERNK